ncbi:uncharacterized protein TERG_07284 [Trichophyton rubrum CBS 118892]|uniref:Uncharacterized protein n=1 Tax=Trichophyton rubrum (strain ATCC MYA-4607 / CBS 118892) TaxID=559305 RepID=F2SXJ1_TRIRC|nr:uncharacterized protein TERG_07284 [Trichophyton rubrum CBS 118892]EGD91063.1 hypothetical protein TERG_07284 [Trichophyton rubrum CBS 118892]KMQ45971.1 hypothetical protein HL42_3283 [Trichophyton rubrum]
MANREPSQASIRSDQSSTQRTEGVLVNRHEANSCPLPPWSAMSTQVATLGPSHTIALGVPSPIARGLHSSQITLETLTALCDIWNTLHPLSIPILSSSMVKRSEEMAPLGYVSVAVTWLECGCVVDVAG